MRAAVSYLFAPGHRAEWFVKASESGADMVVLDLEDAVDARDKAMARAAIADWLTGRGADRTRSMVRVNDAASRFFAEDLALVAGLGAVAVMLPKVEQAADVAALARVLAPGSAIVPMIESALGLRAVEAIAGADLVQRLAFGTWDFGVDVHLSGDPLGLMMPSAAIALASRCAGIAPPIAGVTTAIGDEAAIRRDCAFARAFGFTAKLCIHPAQIGPVHAGFAPSAAEIEWAQRVVGAVTDGAAVQVDGAMVDRPVLLRARAILGHDRAQ